MAIVHDFSYARPSSVQDALSLLEAHGGGASILAGGTDLIVALKERQCRPAVVIDIKAIDDLRRLVVVDARLEIGALVTFADLLRSREVAEQFPLIAESARAVASRGIRNRATLVGNLCSAVPSLDCGPALLVHDAEVRLASTQGNRVVSIHDWFTGPKATCRQPHELVLGVSVPRPAQGHAGCYVKLGRYRGEDLAQAGIGVMALADGSFRVACCALAPVAARARIVETVLSTGKDAPDILGRAKAALDGEIAPITDIRASERYRREMAKVMLERGIREASCRLHGSADDASLLLGG